MSGRGEDLVQVWLPEAGVWAAVPANHQAAHIQHHSGSAPSSSDQRKRETGRSSRKRALDSTLEAQQRAKSHRAEQPGLEQVSAAGGSSSAAAAGTSAAAAAATAHPTYTGFGLQHDKNDSEVEEYEAPPTCPICECTGPPSADAGTRAPRCSPICTGCLATSWPPQTHVALRCLHVWPADVCLVAGFRHALLFPGC